MLLPLIIQGTAPLRAVVSLRVPSSKSLASANCHTLHQGGCTYCKHICHSHTMLLRDPTGILHIRVFCICALIQAITWRQPDNDAINIRRGSDLP